MDIQDMNLVRTCEGSPEQYEVFCKDGTCIAYLRLRHGEFTVKCPDAHGECVYCATPKGYGTFEDDERDEYIKAAKQAIAKYYSRIQKESTISIKFSCFSPSVIMKIAIPADRDEEEYIDELLDAILKDEFRHNCEWNFA